MPAVSSPGRYLVDFIAVQLARRDIFLLPGLAAISFPILRISSQGPGFRGLQLRLGQGKLEKLTRGNKRRAGFRQETVAVERSRPFGKAADQVAKQALLGEPHNRRDLQVALAEELLIGEAHCFDQLFAAHREEQLSDPQPPVDRRRPTARVPPRRYRPGAFRDGCRDRERGSAGRTRSPGRRRVARSASGADAR